MDQKDTLTKDISLKTQNDKWWDVVWNMQGFDKNNSLRVAWILYIWRIFNQSKKK